jgi:hypothetical protein
MSDKKCQKYLNSSVKRCAAYGPVGGYDDAEGALRCCHCYKTTNKSVEEAAGFLLMHLQIYPNIFLASHCHHQWVVVSSEATQAVCIVDIY